MQHMTLLNSKIIAKAASFAISLLLRSEGVGHLHARVITFWSLSGKTCEMTAPVPY